MKLHTFGIVDADTVADVRLDADETRTLQSLCEAIYYCFDYECATVAGAAGLMREQRQEELMGAPYSCSRDDDERHDEWGAMHLARHLEVFAATNPLVREFEAAVAELLQLMRAGKWSTVGEMIDETDGFAFDADELRINVQLRSALERLGDYAERFSLAEPWEDNVITPIMDACEQLANTVRYNDPPDDRPTPCPYCGKADQ